MLSHNQQKLLNKLTNPRLRRKTGFFLCEGKRSSEEALRHCCDQVELLITTARGTQLVEEFLGKVPHCEISEEEFSQISSTESPQGILVIVKEPEMLEGPLTDPFALVLDRVMDPGNFGTIVRTAWAIGLKEVWYTLGTTDPFSAKAVRSAMGAHFHLKFRSFPDLAAVEAQLAPQGGHLFLTKPNATCSCFSNEFSFTGHGIVFGNEANGIEYSSASSRDVTIPMLGCAESLNVAQAATIVLFEYVRRVTG